jgi:hypothetical protein
MSASNLSAPDQAFKHVTERPAQCLDAFVAEQAVQVGGEDIGVVLVPGLAFQDGTDLAGEREALGMALAVPGLGLAVALGSLLRGQ